MCAAPKGNKFALGNEGGRPLIHDDPKKVDALINDYFEWIKGEYKKIVTKKATDDNEEEFRMECVRNPEPPTVSGLSIHIGFASKSTLYDYEKKQEFSHSIKRALSRIEKHHEIAVAYGDKCTGNIFALKNFGWKDKSEVDNNHTGSITITRHVKK